MQGRLKRVCANSCAQRLPRAPLLFPTQACGLPSSCARRRASHLPLLVDQNLQLTPGHREWNGSYPLLPRERTSGAGRPLAWGRHEPREGPRSPGLCRWAQGSSAAGSVNQLCSSTFNGHFGKIYFYLNINMSILRRRIQACLSV